jgi:hypothetical protein
MLKKFQCLMWLVVRTELLPIIKELHIYIYIYIMTRNLDGVSKINSINTNFLKRNTSLESHTLLYIKKYVVY